MNFLKGFYFIPFILLLSSNALIAQKKLTTSFFFETDRYVLDDDQRNLFRQFVNELNPAEVISVDIFGFCDDRGPKIYNDTLSLKRAEFIHDLLVQKGILSEKIKLVSGKGKISLVSQVAVDNQRDNNRRVDVVINYNTPKPTSIPQNIIQDTLKIGDKIILENVLFENSRSILLQESIPVVERLAELVKEKKKYNFAILGHICCNPPNVDVLDLETGERNLSTARAKLIYDYFIYRGIGKNRLTYKGMMANFPLGKGEKYDRRVELVVTGINEIK